MEIRFDNVSYNYRFRGISYTFLSGEITCVIGKSGSGKSLIGYIIMGLVNVSGGSVFYDDSRVCDLRRLRKDIGYVFQNPMDHIFCNTVFDEVSFGLREYGYKVDKERELVSKALRMVGLGDWYMERDPHYLSSGEVVRVAIASSLVLNPKVLVLDEVMVYLDGKGKRMLCKLLKLLRDRYKKTIIVISNDIECVSSIYDNYVMFDNYEIVSSGSKGDIILNSDVLMRYDMEVLGIFRFIKLCNDRGIGIGYHNDIDDLVLDVLDNV